MPGDDYESPYTDDVGSIADDEVVYRRVHHHFILWDRASGETPPGLAKVAFQDYPEERAHELGCPGAAMSVHRASVVEAQGLQPGDLLEDTTQGLVRMKAGDLRAHRQGIQPWPTEEDPSHAVVFSLVGPERTRGQQRRTRDIAEWVVVPERPADDEE